MPLPIPDPNRSGHYKSYADMKRDGDISGVPTESYPSTQEAHAPRKTLHERQGCPPSTLTAQNVRMIINCDECKKPRCIYADHVLKQEEVRELQNIKRTYTYVCGAVITPDDSNLKVRYEPLIQTSYQLNILGNKYTFHHTLIQLNFRSTPDLRWHATCRLNACCTRRRTKSLVNQWHCVPTVGWGME